MLHIGMWSVQAFVFLVVVCARRSLQASRQRRIYVEHDYISSVIRQHWRTVPFEDELLG